MTTPVVQPADARAESLYEFLRVKLNWPAKWNDLQPWGQEIFKEAAAHAAPSVGVPPAVRIYWHASNGWQVEWLGPAPNGGQSNFYYAVPVGVPLSDERAALRDVAAERQRQIEREGWTPEHDDAHDAGEIAAAASAYALAAADRLHPMSQGDGGFDAGLTGGVSEPPSMWCWDREWWKPADPRRMLVKAGALILAEIERLDRAVLAASLEKK